jgi:hypothetical protein
LRRVAEGRAHLTHPHDIDRPTLVILCDRLRPKQPSFLTRPENKRTKSSKRCLFVFHLSRIPMKLDRSDRTKVSGEEHAVCLQNRDGTRAVVISAWTITAIIAWKAEITRYLPGAGNPGHIFVLKGDNVQTDDRSFDEWDDVPVEMCTNHHHAIVILRRAFNSNYLCFGQLSAPGSNGVRKEMFTIEF